MPAPVKRVLVTRAAHQASALGDALAARGLTVVSVPAIALEPPSDGYAVLDSAIRNLDDFDWVLFTSANAVGVFQQRQEAIDRYEVPCRIASIGAATSRVLRGAELPVHLQPDVAIAEELVVALLPYARCSRMLLVRAETGRDLLPAELRKAGAELVIAPAYRTVVPDDSIVSLQREMATMDAITFTSSSSVRNLLELCTAANVMLPRDVVLASIGPITSQTLREAGYTPAVEAATADIEVLASDLARYLEHR